MPVCTICALRDKGYYVTKRANSGSTSRNNKASTRHALGSLAGSQEPVGLPPSRCSDYLVVSGGFLGIFSAACCRGALRVLRAHLLARGRRGQLVPTRGALHVLACRHLVAAAVARVAP